MTAVRVPDILLRVSPRNLEKYNALAVAGAGRGRVKPLPYTFTRAAPSASYIDRDGTLRLAGVDVPRIEWVDLDGDGVRETPGILLEGSRTNELQRSEELDNAYWTKGRLTAAADQTTAPDGTSTADKLTEDSTTDTHIVFSGSVSITAGAALAASMFFKASSRTKVRLAVYDSTIATEFFHANYDLSAGTVISTGGTGVTSAHIQPAGSGLYRCMVEGTGQGGATTAALIAFLLDAGGNTNYLGDGASHLFAWGGQLEKAAFPSSYIKTTTAAVTRAADSLTVPFNFGPMDLTVLSRAARPVHADVSGALGFSPRIYELAGTQPFLRAFFDNLSRNFFSQIDTIGTDGGTGGLAIPSGADLRYLTQYRNLATTGGQAAHDAGTGLSAFSTAASAFSAFGNQILHVGGKAGIELYGVLLDLPIARGLFGRAEMLAVP